MKRLEVLQKIKYKKMCFAQLGRNTVDMMEIKNASVTI